MKYVWTLLGMLLDAWRSWWKGEPCGWIEALAIIGNACLIAMAGGVIAFAVLSAVIRSGVMR